jgi:hypothetical protein
MMTFLLSLTCFFILKCIAGLLGFLSAFFEYCSWVLDWLDNACFQWHPKLDGHAERYIVREPAQTIRPNKRRS